MIAHDSPLRNLPQRIDRKQALFLDGIRHACEIAFFAHQRLRTSLAEIALSYPGPTPSDAFSGPFVDAWAVVDSLDRMRGLLQLMPGLTFRPSAENRPRFVVETESIRSVRNVSDHLAERADFVIARQGTALGVLSWVTPLDGQSARSCALRPGVLFESRTQVPNPLGRTVNAPSDLIVLEAGGHRASLTDAMEALARTVSYLESSLASAWIAQKLDASRAPSDVLVVAQIEIQ